MAFHNTIKFSLFCLLLLSSTVSYSQKESEIISKYRMALKTAAEDLPEPPITMKGNFIIQKMTFPGVIYYHKPNTRMELMFQNMTFINVTNDSLQWDYNPLEDKNTIVSISREDREKSTKREKALDFASKDLLNYKALRHQLKYKGKVKMDSIEVSILELTKKDKTTITFSLNTRNNLIYKAEDHTGHIYYADYIETENYVYPRFIRHEFTDQQMEIRIRELSINSPIADSLFIIPAEVFDEKRKSSNKIDALISQGDSLYWKGEYESAIKKYSEVIRQDGNNHSAFNSRGLAKIELQQYYEAIADFNTSLEIIPDAANALNNRGLAKFYLGDNNGALNDYTAALKIDSSFATGYKNRGLLNLRTDEYKEASDDFLKAIKINPDDGEAHFKYGVAIAQLEKYDDAIVSYQNAKKLNYKTGELHNYLGVSEYKLGRYDSAATNFKVAHTLNPDNLQYLENYGNALYANEDYINAQKQFEKYLKIKNDNPEVHNMIGLCKFQDEDYKGAIKDFSRSIELNEKGALYYDNRAAAREMIEDYEGAIKDYSQSIAIYPNDASVFYKRGLIKIHTSKKIEGCLDLGTANEMEYEAAREAIIKNCN